MAPITVACAPASGATFTIGTTPVNCTASDSLARRAQCAFSVTLTAQFLSVTKFVAFGDSITKGEIGFFDAFGVPVLDVPNSYPTKLEAMLNLEYPGQGITVPEQGRGGEFVGDAVRRLPGVLAAEHPPALLLLDGYNDLLANCHFPSANTPICPGAIAEVVKKLRECVHIARTPAYEVRYVFLSTLTPNGPWLGGVNDRRIAPDAIAQVNAGIRSMVAAEGAILVDPYPLFIGHEAEYVNTDGLHLRPAGYQVLADTFFAAIKATIASTPGFNQSTRP